jgi:glutamyl-tRNA reductase
MHLLLIGINHTSAPVSVRERFAISAERMPDALLRLQQTKSILECVIVSTCNRMEIYTVVDKLERGRDHLRRFIQSYFQVSDRLLDEHSYRIEHEEVQEHLFRVAAGLDSLVVGETQILGQVRDGFLEAQQLGTTGILFNKLFKTAITLAKKAHAETGIADNPVSIGYAAVELARQLFGRFDGKHVIIIGAGKMAELTVKHLMSQGACRFSIVNRTLDHAQQLASLCRGQAHSFEQLQHLLIDADVVISSTGAEQYILAKEQIHRVMQMRKNRMLFMIDIAMPRDLDPAIHEVDNVFLYDLDDLQGLVDFNLGQRRKAVSKIEEMITVAQSEYLLWVRTLGVSPLIKGLQDRAESIHGETMANLRNRLPDLTERELKIIHKLSKSMLNQFMREPILKLKELSVSADGEQAQELFSQLFAIDEQTSQVTQINDVKVANANRPLVMSTIDTKE